jgi:hypothetical protein
MHGEPRIAEGESTPPPLAKTQWSTPAVESMPTMIGAPTQQPWRCVKRHNDDRVQDGATDRCSAASCHHRSP